MSLSVDCHVPDVAVTCLLCHWAVQQIEMNCESGVYIYNINICIF